MTATEEISIVMKNSKWTISDQALAIPVEALGTQYIVMSKNKGQDYGSEFIVVATQNNTSVNIDPSNYIYDPLNITLNRGEGYLYAVNYDVSGTIITANKPVAVVNGNKCASVPDYTNYCEHLFEMAIPVNHWGTEILAANLPRS